MGGSYCTPGIELGSGRVVHLLIVLVLVLVIVPRRLRALYPLRGRFAIDYDDEDEYDHEMGLAAPKSVNSLTETAVFRGKFGR